MYAITLATVRLGSKFDKKCTVHFKIVYVRVHGGDFVSMLYVVARYQRFSVTYRS